MTILNQLLDLPNLKVEQVALDGDQIVMLATPTCSDAPCPSCGASSTRVHSHYQRILQDLPWGLRHLRMTLNLRRFRCHQAPCPRQTFVERLPQIAPPYARVTARLRTQQLLIACAVTGELGARLTARLGMRCSPDTLLRLVRHAPLPAPPPPRIIGIDDWAKRKGRDYGTLIIDLERRAPIDVLPERTADAVAAWLAQHPTVEVVSRDRADAYIHGVTRGAPAAKQIADRWHLTKNLGDALQRLLERHGPQLRAAATPAPAVSPAAPSGPAPAATSAGDRGTPVPNLQAKPHHQARFAEVKQLRARGWSISRVARQVGLNRRTVRRYDQLDQVPVRVLPQNCSEVLPFLPAVQAFIAQGEFSCQQIWAGLHAQGFSGSYSSVLRFLKRLGWQAPSRQPPPAPGAARLWTRHYSARQVLWMLLRETTALKPEEATYRERLLDRCPILAKGHALTQRFLRLLRERDGASFDAWLADAETSGIKELKQFAKGLRQDDAAVRNALHEPWSNGPVEAQVQQLKLIKRSMKGRANFDLLRKRVLLQI